ncbi:hypothetical protein GPECTOR_3g249 [Gonium pectorale]|uniref:Uncharacterized protein n=1 Tax=Gonium pectorale TaxID=33097 RepID=A0A150GZ81_GONPE|nr:hypothetical protein GPECTOR_3g249 [Gonium pectorale]|eukprot:KXZ55094.1 hypothetical protein GPECTOR_3g249 [Gonium pectorale]
MERNQRMLEQMGLASAVQSLREEAKPKAPNPAPKRRRGDQENAAGEERVLRRSLRAKGKEPELPPLLEPLFRRPDNAHKYDQPVRKPRAQGPPADGGDAAKFDAHNLHRLRTMSDEAMLKRIGKITNTLKLKSLVQLLRSFGRDELAEAAQEALDERLACV